MWYSFLFCGEVHFLVLLNLIAMVPSRDFSNTGESRICQIYPIWGSQGLADRWEHQGAAAAFPGARDSTGPLQSPWISNVFPPRLEVTQISWFFKIFILEKAYFSTSEGWAKK